MKELLHLYELPGEYERLHELLTESGGELTDEIQELMCDLNDNLEIKAERIAALIRRNTAYAEQAREEAARVAKLARSRENTAQRLKDYLTFCMEELGRNRIETPTAVVTLQRNSQPRVEWQGDPSAIPAVFVKPVPPPVPELDSSRVVAVWRYREALKLVEDLEAAQVSYSQIDRARQKVRDAFDRLPLDLVTWHVGEVGVDEVTIADIPEECSITVAQHVRVR